MLKVFNGTRYLPVSGLIPILGTKYNISVPVIIKLTSWRRMNYCAESNGSEADFIEISCGHQSRTVTGAELR